MNHPSDYLGQRRLVATVESRHSISSGNGKPLYRVELRNIRDEAEDEEIWPRKTVSDGKKWDEVPTGSRVSFDAKLDFDRNNSIQILSIRNVEVQEGFGSAWWKLW